jgi:hypothetical protein
VITTSWSLSGSVCLYCMLPIWLNLLGLMVRTRLVPSASGLPGHVSAEAEAAPLATARQKNNVAMKRIRPLTPARSDYSLNPNAEAGSTYEIQH